MSASRGKAVEAEEDPELLSAWADGELDADQHAAMLERLKKDPELRTRLEWFNLVGDALRSHEVAACHSPALVGRVCRTLESEPVRIGPGSRPGSRLGRHMAAGVAVAAAAGVLAVVALPQLRNAQVMPAAPAAPQAVASAERAAVPGATTPAPKALAASSPQLDAYIRAHREMAFAGMMPSAVAYVRMSGEPDR